MINRLAAPLRIALSRYLQPGRSPAQETDQVVVHKKPDVLVFPVIEWRYRWQRPQAVAEGLARLGYRVFYFDTEFRAEICDYEPEPIEIAVNLYTLQLPAGRTPIDLYAAPLPDASVEIAVSGIELLRARQQIGACVCLVQHPSWLPVVTRLCNCCVIYDCMDAYEAFPNAGPHVGEFEGVLAAYADQVICSARFLQDRLRASAGSEPTLIRNAVSEGAIAAGNGHQQGNPPVVGYLGAIAEWIDIPLLTDLAALLPEYEFRLVGEAGLDISSLQARQNVTLVGEVERSRVATEISGFDVGLIPYLPEHPVSQASDPVKIYEYLAQGKPVVAAGTTEMQAFAAVAQLASGAAGFADAIKRAIREDTVEARKGRIAFARKNTWDVRARQFDRALRTCFPMVSVIIPVFNNLSFTQGCLWRLEHNTHYPSWELVVVNDGSSDASSSWLETWAQPRPWVRLVHRTRNGGFAQASNSGARVATGDYLVFLNNDTSVTPGWMGDMLWHFRHEPRLGLLGPVTNKAGNECVIPIEYQDMETMQRSALAHTRRHRRTRRPLDSVHFFCAMLPRQVWERVGELDERFEIAFFEDDDYSFRVRAAGYKLACAEDVFIHHHLSATIDALGPQRRQELFEENRKRFEAKWGPWRPHRFREEMYR